MLPSVFNRAGLALLEPELVRCRATLQESEDARIARAGVSMSTDAATAYTRVLLDSIEPRALAEGGFGLLLAPPARTPGFPCILRCALCCASCSSPFPLAHRTLLAVEPSTRGRLNFA